MGNLCSRSTCWCDTSTTSCHEQWPALSCGLDDSGTGQHINGWPISINVHHFSLGWRPPLLGWRPSFFHPDEHAAVGASCIWCCRRWAPSAPPGNGGKDRHKCHGASQRRCSKRCREPRGSSTKKTTWKNRGTGAWRLKCWKGVERTWDEPECGSWDFFCQKWVGRQLIWHSLMCTWDLANMFATSTVIRWKQDFGPHRALLQQVIPIGSKPATWVVQLVEEEAHGEKQFSWGLASRT